MSNAQKQQPLKVPPKSKGLAKLRGLIENKNEGPVRLLTGTHARDHLEVGDRMKDGTIYGGESPTTHKPMYVAPVDGSVTMTFNDAATFAKDLKVGNRKGFRMPDDAELQVLYANKDQGALKGTFNTTGKSSWVGSAYDDEDDDYGSANGYWDSPGSYWSSKKKGDMGQDMNFSTGKLTVDTGAELASVRCIR